MPCNGMFLGISVGRHYTVNCLIVQLLEQKDIPAQKVLKKYVLRKILVRGGLQAKISVIDTWRENIAKN